VGASDVRRGWDQGQPAAAGGNEPLEAFAALGVGQGAQVFVAFGEQVERDQRRWCIGLGAAGGEAVLQRGEAQLPIHHYHRFAIEHRPGGQPRG
jgi:hypothetical protein